MKRSNILVANNEPLMLKLLSRVLKLEGYRVAIAMDLKMAIKLISQNRKLSLVVMEFDSDARKGIEACRRLRQLTDMPIIILASKYQGNDVVTALDAGADDFIKEPVVISEFVARVKAVLRLSGVQFSPAGAL